MKDITVATRLQDGKDFKTMLHPFVQSDLVGEIIVSGETATLPAIPKCRLVVTDPFISGGGLETILNEVDTEYLVLFADNNRILPEPGALERLLAQARSTGAALTYSDFYDGGSGSSTLHPLIDYQEGSVRDDFDFGKIILVSVPAARDALKRYGPIPPVKYAALYDLRLKLSMDRPICRVGEPLYTAFPHDPGEGDGESRGEAHFAYVDPRNIHVQKEMETVFTNYLKFFGAYVSPSLLGNTGSSQDVFPVEASVIIPVKNRVEIIADAVNSALSQETGFPFNVIVVDNHSTDGTTATLSRLTGQQGSLIHIIPERSDLGIGGCWNEALYSRYCGRYAVQLDSDDLYIDRHTLAKIVGLLQGGRYAMVIGSYTIVDFDLNEIPPGLIDHREWTDDNGHNNALRINGLGAPRAFHTATMRRFGFPDVSYGEDYAAALRICREYRIGRIFESLYLCRRWSGNTDAGLSIETTNKNNLFKDRVRTEEMAKRKTFLERCAARDRPGKRL